ncbi:hypothetical protein GCM10011611_62220 [Aliidongia dinghuensis]|uniref:Uncharacterized protein n=1 Tax=Aliidongia dinghuensis TaxID=1867774 RepID=A0A8J2Z0Z4_9PROT|nr:hypothetical protein GCM10011611_62220 [Aliidongia dinghuensis]
MHAADADLEPDLVRIGRVARRRRVRPGCMSQQRKDGNQRPVPKGVGPKEAACRSSTVPDDHFHVSVPAAAAPRSAWDQTSDINWGAIYRFPRRGCKWRLARDRPGFYGSPSFACAPMRRHPE